MVPADTKTPDQLTWQELRDERNSLIKRQREMYGAAETRARQTNLVDANGRLLVRFNPEERSEIDKLIGFTGADGKEVLGRIGQLDNEVEVRTRANNLDGQADAARHQRMQQLESRDPTAGRWISPPPIGGSSLQGAGSDGANLFNREETRKLWQRPEFRSQFGQWTKFGLPAFNNEEIRALQMDIDVQGGFMVAPQEFVKELIIFVNNLVFVRSLARVFTCENAESLGAPSLETDISDPNWTAEIATGTEDSSMVFGKRELRPHPVAKLIKVSEKLLRASVLNVEGVVRDRMAYKFGVVEEAAFMTGPGTDQPLGVFTASNFGISTGRDVSTGNTTTALTADGLIGAFYNLKFQYMMSKSTQWCFHRTALQTIRQLKDGIGQYIWQAGLSDDRPDTILGKRYFMSEYAPNTFTTGQYVGIVGDWSFYWIADALAMRVQRLVELYAGTAQVGFIGRKETDGMPVLEQAFSRVKLA